MSLSVDVHKDLGSFKLDVSFELPHADETLALLGPSGCGKSLTLGCIAGTVRPDAGRVVLDGTVLFDSEKGVNLPPQKRNVGYLFQQYALFPNMTVLQNVMVGAKGDRAERERTARSWIDRMQVTGLEGRRPAQLSGGQQQRVALARMFASEPALVLLDEPFSALDGHLRWTLEMGLSDTLKSYRGGALYVSHNRDEVYRLCDSVCVVTDGANEPPEPTHRFFEYPRTVPAATISGCKNISAATVTADGELDCPDWGVRLRTSLPIADGTCAAGIRAHYFTVAGPGEEGNVICGRVERVIDNTFSMIVMVRTLGGAAVRYECDKELWRALDDPKEVTLAIDPRFVMPLTAGGRS